MLADTIRDLGTQIAHLVKEHFAFAATAYCDGVSAEISVTSPDSRFEEQKLREPLIAALAVKSVVEFKRCLNIGRESRPTIPGDAVVRLLALIALGIRCETAAQKSVLD